MNENKDDEVEQQIEKEEDEEQAKKTITESEFLEKLERDINIHVRTNLLPRLVPRIVKPHHVYIHVVDEPWITHVVGGMPVQIYLSLEAFRPPGINVHLMRDLSLIVARKLVSPAEVIPYSFVLEQKSKLKEFVKKEFGDLAEIIHTLLEQDRLIIKRRTIREIVIKDRLTGIVTTVKTDDENETDWGLLQKARMKLSRLVANKEKIIDVMEKLENE